jgi:hypothetical protein
MSLSPLGFSVSEAENPDGGAKIKNEKRKELKRSIVAAAVTVVQNGGQ